MGQRDVHDNARISYVYSSEKNKAPMVPPSPSTKPAGSPTRASASTGEARGTLVPSFPSTPGPVKVNPAREESAPSPPSTTPAAAWPQSAESIRCASAREEDTTIAGLGIEEIPRPKVAMPSSPPRPFQIGCAPSRAGRDDDRRFLFNSETDDDDLDNLKELHARFEEVHAQVAKYN